MLHTTLAEKESFLPVVPVCHLERFKFQNTNRHYHPQNAGHG